MRNLLFGDWGTKITALLLAALVWAAIYSAEVKTIDLRPDLRLVVSPDVDLASLRVLVGGEEVGRWVYGQSPESIGSIPLRVTASGTALGPVVEDLVLVVLEIDAERVEGLEGSRAIRLPADGIRGLPAGAVAEPGSARGGEEELRIEYVLFERRRLMVDTTNAAVGDPATGYTLSIAAQPSEIWVDVPATFEEDRVRPEPVRVQGLAAGFRTPEWRLVTPGVRDADPFILVVSVEPTPETKHQIMLPVQVVRVNGVPVRRWEMGEQAQLDGSVYRIPITLIGPGRLINAADVASRAWVIIDVPTPLEVGSQVGVDDAWVRVIFDDAAMRGGVVRYVPFGHEEESQRDITVSITVTEN